MLSNVFDIVQSVCRAAHSSEKFELTVSHWTESNGKLLGWCLSALNIVHLTSAMCMVVYVCVC